MNILPPTDIIAIQAERSFGAHTVIETRSGPVTEAEAVDAVKAAGYTVIREDDGGYYATYDAEDAHGTIGATEGHAGVGVTVRSPEDPRYYWTNELGNGAVMQEDCGLTACGTKAEARMAALDDMVASTDLGEHERINVVAVGEGDCWARVPREWTSSGINMYARQKGIDPKDISIRRPGDHPGQQHQAWISITACVFGARVDARSPFSK